MLYLLTPFYLELPPVNNNCKHFHSPKSEPMFDETFNLSIKEFYINFMLEPTLNFIQDYHQSIEYTETEIDDWALTEEQCCKRRELRFRVPIKATLGSSAYFKYTSKQYIDNIENY